MPTPTPDQETGLSWLRTDPCITLDTSDSTVQTRLRRRGWKPISRSGDYLRFRLPVSALTIRSASAIRASRTADLAARVPGHQPGAERAVAAQ